ncbi:MAG: alpha/beta hydrolase [Oscillospiraceae bacterium]|nr:alpha/beta hydrolase [Oscillospiraceae bacterium]
MTIKMKEILDVTYRIVDGNNLKLDIFLPDNVESPPLIFWVHGGAWMMGDRKWCGMKNQIDRGYAVVSVDYRLSTVAPFPACIEDCKYALAFLRENANKYPIDLTRICAAGDSAGGHLVALMGTSAGHEDWEPVGADCSVQAVIDLYGPTLTRPSIPIEEGEPPVLSTLLGSPIYSPKGRMTAAAASPLTYIDGTEPPFLIIHGDCDDIVHIKQSYALRDALEEHETDVIMYTVLSGGHGFECPTVDAVIDGFLDYVFKGIKPKTPEWAE